VNRLVLYAPAWTFTTRPAIGGGEAPLGAYRTVSKDSARQRWLNGVPEAKKADLIPDGWFEQWADATWALDPAGERQTPPVLRAPNGVLQDFRTYWIAGKPQYDPADIRVPTLLIHAEWDADLPSDQAHGYFAKLTNCALQALHRNRRRHALDHDGEEPHAVLPRDHEFSRRARPEAAELDRDPIQLNRITV
jgi:pimeloyl-ACP methyl ester carboxylesterase